MLSRARSAFTHIAYDRIWVETSCIINAPASTYLSWVQTMEKLQSEEEKQIDAFCYFASDLGQSKFHLNIHCEQFKHKSLITFLYLKFISSFRWKLQLKWDWFGIWFIWFWWLQNIDSNYWTIVKRTLLHSNDSVLLAVNGHQKVKIK